MTEFITHRLFTGRIAMAFFVMACLAVDAAFALALTPPMGTRVTNTATATFSGENGYVFPQVTSATVETEISGAPVLTISANANPNPVSAGETLTYTIIIRNTGNLSATAVTTTPTLSANLQFQSATRDGIVLPSAPSWDLGDIPSGGSLTLIITSTVIPGTPNGTELPFSITATAAEGARDAISLTTPVGSAPHLVLSLSASVASTAPGGFIVYTLHYSNIGNMAANNGIIHSELPSQTALVSGSITGGGSLVDRTITWPVGIISPGSSGNVSFRASVSTIAADGAIITSIATITSNETVPESSNQLFIPVVVHPSLQFTKTVPTQDVAPGAQVIYTFTITNDGDVKVTGIVLEDPLPSPMTFIGSDSPYTLTAGTVRWAIGDIDPGAIKTVHLTVSIDTAVTLGMDVTNTASVTSVEVQRKTASATLSTSVTARTPGVVAFFDVSWQPAYGYMGGDTLYLQAMDPDQNLDPSVDETVTVVLTNPTQEAISASKSSMNKAIPNVLNPDTETMTLYETGPDTGIFRGSIPSTLTVTDSENGEMTVVSSTRIRVVYTDLLDAAPVHVSSALIDPAGIVFDSATGMPVSGAQVILRNWNNQTDSCDVTSWPTLPPNQVNPAPATGDDGRFAFPLVPPDDYCFQVIPPTDYTYPSAVPDEDLPTGFTIGDGSRGGKFTMSIGDPPLINDIPLDPPSGLLRMTKTANKTMASMGDLVIYTLKMDNTGQSPVHDIRVSDVMPHGMSYISGSTLIGGMTAADPIAGGKRTWTWPLTYLAPGNSIELSYRAVVGPDTPPGHAINTASCSGTSVGRPVVSNNAFVKISISQGVFTTKGTIIGRVFMDEDGNGLANHDKGIPDVALYLEDGTRVITDQKGKFSITGVSSGTHVLRLDETSLPPGLVPKPLSNRFMTSGTSQFVDMTPGGLFKANFAVDKPAPKPTAPPEKAAPKDGMKKNETAPDIIEPEKGGSPPATLTTREGRLTQTGVATKTDAALPLTAKEASEPSLSKQMLTLSPELDILTPLDQSVSMRNSIRVHVKTPTHTSLTLTVNGANVPDRQIGTKIENNNSGVILYEFIDVRLKSGQENLICAEIKDAAGLVRGTQKIRVGNLGKPERIGIRPDLKEVEADGQSRIGVTVSVEDHKGRPVPAFPTITASVTSGDILETDADPSTEGLQIPCKDGIAHFSVIAPRETGDAKIYVEVGNLNESADIYFAPNQRQMFIVGLGEVTLGHGRSSGDTRYLEDRTFYDDGTYLNGRGAFFLKGNLYKDIVITSAYDSNKNSSDELFRESDTRLDSEDKYPVYGDESTTGYEALSRENLYVKLEKGKSSLLYGDYRTDLTETTLGSYTRSFNGLKFEGHTDRLHLRAFGTYTDQSQFKDTLPGKGISGLYYLNNHQIIQGTERVVIETRDRLQPDHILKKEIKLGGSDYDIDYDMGTLLFKAPIPSHDAQGNPIYIIVTYEGLGDGDKYGIYGGRASYKVSERLNIGATGIVEENAISDYHLTATDVTLNLPFKTIVKAEYANTRSLFDLSNSLDSQTGDGWAFDIKSQPIEHLSLGGYYRILSDYFNNPSATDAIRGTRKWGLDGDYEIMPGLNITAKYLDEYDAINVSSHQLASAGATKKFSKTTLSAEVSHETSTNLTETPSQTPYTPGGLLNGVPFLNAYETPDQSTSLKLALERELLPNVTMSLSHKQDVDGNELSLSQGGLDYNINDKNRLYVREEYAKNQNDTQIRTLLGAESQLTKSTTAYEEYRISDGSAGSRNQQVLGLKNTFKIRTDTTLNLAGEYLSTLSGDENINEPDAYAVAGGVEYLPKGDIKLTGRTEHRHELVDNGNDSYLAEAGMAYKLNPDYTMLLRERYFLEKRGVDGEDHASRAMVGIAYRPLVYDRFNALSKIEYKYEKRTSPESLYSTDSYIFSTEGNYQFSRKLQLTGKYAGKLEKQDTISSYTDLISARFIYDLTDRFDVGAEYRLLTSHLTHSRLHGGSAEVGYRIIQQLWFSLGYSFDRFDADLEGDSYHGDGPFMKLRFKFDENTLKRIRKDS
ncbi:MAG: DUF11 domain-containing protein [Proteobacteria bacterium]|nr:DUF11 domain-containing protein [Pseudomonadota bacterium]